MKFGRIGITEEGVVEIRYEKDIRFLDRINQHCEEAPLPSFAEALQAFRKPVINICELAPETEDRLLVLYVSFKTGSDGTRSMSVTVKKFLVKGGAFKFTTPTIYESDPPHTPWVNAGKLKAEATRYIQGERLQGRLNLETPEKGDQVG